MGSRVLQPPLLAGARHGGLGLISSSQATRRTSASRPRRNITGHPAALPREQRISPATTDVHDSVWGCQRSLPTFRSRGRCHGVVSFPEKMALLPSPLLPHLELPWADGRAWDRAVRLAKRAHNPDLTTSQSHPPATQGEAGGEPHPRLTPETAVEMARGRCRRCPAPLPRGEHGDTSHTSRGWGQAPYLFSL